jgi:uncharacterized protein with HEPN domain
MRHDPRKYLWDARRAVDLVVEFIADADRTEYRDNLFLRSAVERQFEIIGEALHQLSRRDQELASRIPDLPRIVAFRNRLIHGYSVIDHDVIWNTATRDLPALRRRLDELLAED